MKKYIIFMAIVALLIFGNCTSAQAKLLVDHAKAGKHASWSLDDNGVMTVEGKGTVEVNSNQYWDSLKNTKEIIVKEGITSLYFESYSAVSNIKNVKLPKSLKRIQTNCFEYFKGIKILKLPLHLQTIGEEAFKNCKSLKTLTIPNSVTKIGKGAFDNCNSLETLVLPKHLKKMNADFSKTKCLRKVVNRSKMWIPLDTCGGNGFGR